MDFRLRERDADAENTAFATGQDADRGEHGAVDDLTVDAHLFITHIQDEVRRFAEWSLAPLFCSSSSSNRLARLTCAVETSVPQSSCITAATLRVETPWTYISATASLERFAPFTTFERGGRTRRHGSAELAGSACPGGC